MRLSPHIKPLLFANDLRDRCAFPDPYESWLKMLAFGAVVGAVASTLSASWGFAQLSARAHNVPSRRMLTALFPYLTLSIAASQWMSTWALTSFGPLIEPNADRRGRKLLTYWRTTVVRLLITTSFILLSLRLWGLIGAGLRPAFNGLTASFIAQGSDAAVTVLLWTHLRSVAVAQGFEGLVWRSVIVMVGRGGTLIFLFIVPLGFAMGGHPLRLSWEFVNIRFCLAVLWDVIAALVLTQFGIAVLRRVSHKGS